MVKLFLSIFTNVLLLSNWYVCEYAYPGSKISWDIFIPMDKMCHNMWALIIMCSFFIARSSQPTTRMIRTFLNIAIGLSCSDVMDRLIFGITDFTGSDKILIPLTIISCIYNHARGKKIVQQ